MTDINAIAAAAIKAEISKQDQVVFKCIKELAPAGGQIIYDYTHASLWARRRKNIIPAVTYVTDVRYVPQPINGTEKL